MIVVNLILLAVLFSFPLMRTIELFQLKYRSKKDKAETEAWWAEYEAKKTLRAQTEGQKIYYGH